MFFNKCGTFIYEKDFEKLKDSFTLKNLVKVQKMNMGFWGWQKLPDKIKHYKVVGNGLVKVPAGIRGIWQDRFEDRYGEVKKVNHPSLVNIFGENEDKELSNMQDEAVNKLLKKNVGFLHRSTGVGKTAIIAKIISKLQCKTLIICCNLELMEQMKNDLSNFFGGIKCKTLSGRKTSQKGVYEDIVIGNIDTLVKLDKEYFKQFDLILADEVDKYLQADNRRDFFGGLSSKYLYGLTGTIKLNYIDDKVFDIYLGDKIELLLTHFTPKIYKVYTGFEYYLDDIKDFHKLKEAMYYNENRNTLIIETIKKTLGNRKGIVFSEYVEHGKILKDKLEQIGIKAFLLIGEVKKDERERIRQEIKSYKGPCVLVGSVKIVGRGFNLPELSVGYLTTCEKFQSNIFQYIGRIIRKHPGKTEAVWYDFVDEMTTILLNQSRARTIQYKKAFPDCQILYY